MSDQEPLRKFQKELNAGISGLLVLGLIVKARRPMYGYEIGQELAGMSEEGLPMHAGALYPVLRSLERSGLLSSQVEPSVSAPPRRFYSPTDLGREALAEWKTAWERTRNIVEHVLEEQHGDRRPRTGRRPKVS